MNYLVVQLSSSAFSFVLFVLFHRLTPQSLVRHLQAVVDGERRGLHEDRVVVDGLVVC